MLFMKKIKSLEKTIAALEKRLEKVEDKQNEMVITQSIRIFLLSLLI